MSKATLGSNVKMPVMMTQPVVMIITIQRPSMIFAMSVILR